MKKNFGSAKTVTKWQSNAQHETDGFASTVIKTKSACDRVIIESSEKKYQAYIGEVSRYVRSAVDTQIRHPVLSFQVPEGHQRQRRLGKNPPCLLLKAESFHWSVKMPGLLCLGIPLRCLTEKNWGLWGSSPLPEIRRAISYTFFLAWFVIEVMF